MEKNYPTAKEMANETAKNWTVKTLDEIFEEVQKECLRGRRYAYYFGSCISKDTRKALKKLKYGFNHFMLDGVPGFKVTW